MSHRWNFRLLAIILCSSSKVLAKYSKSCKLLIKPGSKYACMQLQCLQGQTQMTVIHTLSNGLVYLAD